MTDFLNVDRVIELHEIAAGPAPLLDRDTLIGAVMRPRAGFGEHDAHPSLYDKAAALLHGIASTQCFQDGNKRAAWISTVVCLELNGQTLRDMADIEAEAFVIAVATSAWTDRTVEKAAEWLRVQSRPKELEGGRILLSDLVDDSGTIRNREFTDTEIVGPAVIVARGCVIAGCRWGIDSGGPEAVGWEIDPARDGVLGAIRVEDCVFRNCRFVNVGFADYAEGLAEFYAAGWHA